VSAEADRAFARFRKTGYFPSLDGLRCLAIVPVVWHHSTPYPYAGLLGRGPLGVDLFFAISGFLITTLLLRERDQAAGVSVRRFYVRRAARIFPLYYAVLGLTALRGLALVARGPTARSLLS
jgi:peptidoglycan/LPS O-acetylase OafA/YrhL